MLEKIKVNEFFAYEHLPHDLQAVSIHFHTVALFLDRTMKDDEAKRQALFKLWEAKNLAVWDHAQNRG